MAKRCAAQQPAGSRRTPDCVEAVRAQPRARSQVYAERITRRRRILNLTAAMAVFVSAGFGFVEVFSAPQLWWTGLVNIVAAAIYAMVPLLYRFGELLPPLTFIGTAYVSIFTICWFVGHRLGAAVLLPGRGLPDGAAAGRRPHFSRVDSGRDRRQHGHHVAVSGPPQHRRATRSGPCR